MVFSPVGLKEDAVDLFEADNMFAVTDGFEHGGEAEVAQAAQDTLGGADHEGDSVLAEDIVAEPDEVELGVEEGPHVFGVEAGDLDGIGDAALDILVDGEVQFMDELGLGEEDEVVVLGEVLEEEAQFAQALDVHEVGVVNDGDEHLALAVDLPSRLDEEFFAGGIAAIGLNVEGLAEDVQGVVVGV